MSDAEVLEMVKAITAPGHPSGYTREDYLETHPLVKHLIEGTQPAITTGMTIPNGTVFLPDGYQTWLHQEIEAAGDLSG